MGGPARRLRILIVEDEAALRDLVADIVVDLGHEALAEATGDAAIERLRGDPSGADMAVIDLVLPGKGGVETLLALRALRPGLPAIIASGHTERTGGAVKAAIEAARREGAELLAKPFRAEQLEAAIARVTTAAQRA